MSWSVESGVRRRLQNVQLCGVPRTGLRGTALEGDTGQKTLLRTGFVLSEIPSCKCYYVNNIMSEL